MKQVLDNITIEPNNNFGGICYFQFCPIEWLASDVIIDFETGAVLTPLNLIDGKSLLTAKAISGTKEFEELQQENRSGTYFTQKALMVINKDTLQRNRLTDTIRYHQHVVLYYDNNKLVKLIGNRNAGMEFKSDFKTGALVADKNFYGIELSFESEHRAPVYQV